MRRLKRAVDASPSSLRRVVRQIRGRQLVVLEGVRQAEVVSVRQFLEALGAEVGIAAKIAGPQPTGAKRSLTRKQWLHRNIGTFMRQYARKAQPATEPNDRRYSRDVQRRLKRLSAVEFSELLADDADRPAKETKQRGAPGGSSKRREHPS